MSKLQIVKIEPLDLPADIVWRITGLHHIKLKDFYVYVSESEGKMYVNKSVPDEDVVEFIKIATYPKQYCLDDDSEMGLLANSIYEKYGFAAFSNLNDYHSHTIREQDKQKAAERVQNALSTIQKNGGHENI